MDDQVAAAPGRRADPEGAPGLGSDGGRLLRAAGFSLQANAKTLEGAQHRDRDAQFRYINEQVKDHQVGGAPVISVDTKKREQPGRLPMAGREWRPKGKPVQVEDHSFFFTGPGGGAGDPVRDLRQREGRARRAAGKLRATPLFDDPARVLLTLLYQRRAP